MYAAIPPVTPMTISRLARFVGVMAYDVGRYLVFDEPVAFAFAVGALGLDSFQEVLVRDAILGKRNDVAKWVGCVAEHVTSGTGDHECVTLLSGDLVQVAVRLFTQWHGPECRVVVGRVKPGFTAPAPA